MEGAGARKRGELFPSPIRTCDMHSINFRALSLTNVLTAILEDASVRWTFIRTGKRFSEQLLGNRSHQYELVPAPTASVRGQ